MILTQKSQSYRFTKIEWKLGTYIDIHRVGRSTVTAVNQDGVRIEFDRNDMEKDWIRLGSTRPFKRIERRARREQRKRDEKEK